MTSILRYLMLFLLCMPKKRGSSMNRRLYCMFAIFMMISLIVVGCGTDEKHSEKSNEKGRVSGIVPMYTPGAGGPNYIISAGIGQIFKSEKVMPEVVLTTEATSGVVEGTTLLIDRYEKGKPAFAAFTGEALSRAYHGKLKEMPGEHTELLAVGWINSTINHIVVAENSPIKSIDDLKGKRIGTMPPGSTSDNLFNAVLEEGYGISKDDYKPIPLGYAEIQEGIQDGSIDAGVLPGSLPNPTVTELGQLHPIRVISVDEEVLKKLVKTHPYYSYVNVKSGTYPGQDEEVLMSGFESIISTHKDTDEELVYNLVKTMMENTEDLKKIHPAANISEETILNGIQTPLHPGAERYYKEIGIELTNE